MISSLTALEETAARRNGTANNIWDALRRRGRRATRITTCTIRTVRRRVVKLAAEDSISSRLWAHTGASPPARAAKRGDVLDALGGVGARVSGAHVPAALGS